MRHIFLSYWPISIYSYIPGSRVSLLVLVFACSNLYANSENDLLSAIENNDLKAFQEIFNEYQGNFYLDSKESLLQIAIQARASRIIGLLVDAGADINGPTKGFRRKSHLHLAIETGDSELIKSVLELGADINAVDKLGQSPLVHAVLYEDLSTVELLGEYGVNFDNNTSNGEESLIAAIKLGKLSIVEYLVSLGATAPIEKIIDSACSECHGMLGEPRREFTPHIAGQVFSYLKKQLDDYKSRKRDYGRMNGLVEKLTDSIMYEAAKYYSELPRYSSNQKSKTGNISNGELLFNTAVDGSGIPSCNLCHVDIDSAANNTIVPYIFGMNSVYISNQLTNFRSGFRANDESGVMSVVTAKLSDSDIDDIASYLSNITD